MILVQRSGIIAATVLTVGLLFVGCSDEFLEPSVPGTLSPAELTSPAAIEGVIIGAYSKLAGGLYPNPALGYNRFGGAYNWVSGSIQGGDANKGTETGDLVAINEVVEYNLIPTSQIPDDKFEGLYNGVVSANSALKLTLDSDDPNVTEEFRNNMAGQALFLRSHYFFQVAKHFGRFPYFDETMEVREFVDVPNEDNMAKVMADMARAVDLLNETQSAPGMVNKTAAKAYLGKMQLHAGEWDAAKATLTDVIENGINSSGAKLALLSKFGDLFNAEFNNNSESIFAIQASANTGSVNNANYAFDLSHLQGTPIGGCCGFWQPSFDLVDSYRTDEDGLPLTDGSYRDAANRLKTDLNIESDADFSTDEGPVDPRLDHSVGRRGIPYLDWGPHQGKAWIRNQPHGGPYSPKKFIYRQSQAGTLQDGSSWTGGYTALNFNIIRFADVILMAAEANAQTGDLETARELVNQIRTRAANSEGFVTDDDGTPAADYVIGTYDDTWTDQADALEKIYFERKLELSNEGHRFFDLVRWGRAEQDLNSYIDYEKQFLPLQFGAARFTAPQDLYFPVPQSQLDLQTGVLTQNPGY